MAPSCILILSLFLWTFTNAQTYTCAAGQPCVVDCEHTPNVTCNGTIGAEVIIDAEAATSLNLICYKPASCQNILVECPITASLSSFCTVQCSLDFACQNMEIHTHNTTDINLVCSDNEEDRTFPTNTTCQNITIDGEYLAKEDSPPPTQNIAIDCGDEGNAPTDTPSCDLIMTKNIGTIAGATPPTVVNLQLACTVSWDASEVVDVCNRIYIDGGNTRSFTLYLEGDLTNSVINLTRTTYTVDVIMTRVGTMLQSSLYAPEVHAGSEGRFKMNLTAPISFYESTIVGPYAADHAPVEIYAYDNAGFEKSQFEGRFFIRGNGRYVDSTFNAVTAGYVSIQLDADALWDNNKLVLQDSNASLSFFGYVSGTIDASNSMYLSIICKSYAPENSCNGLVLDIPEYQIKNGTLKQKAFLECVDYGCTNVTTRSKNGADDIAVVAILCDCSMGGNGESGDSCIGVINVECDNGKATFDGETCSGYTDCCGSLKQETSSAVCSDNVDSSSGMSDGEIAGVTIGVLFGFLLIASLVCYCQNQRTLRDQFNKATQSNPYTQTLTIEEEKDNDSKGNGVPAGSGGYGATSDAL